MPLRLQLLHASSHVNNPGNESEQSRGGDHINERKEVQLKHDPGNRRHLQDRRHFAGPAWSYLHFPIKNMEHSTADEDDRVPRDDEHRKPGGKSAIIRIVAPVSDAEGNDAAEEQTFVRDRIENNAEGTALVVTARDITIEPVTDGGEKKNNNRGEALPFERFAALDTLTIIDRHRDEGRNHENPNYSDLVGGRHRNGAMMET